MQLNFYIVAYYGGERWKAYLLVTRVIIALLIMV